MTPLARLPPLPHNPVRPGVLGSGRRLHYSKPVDTALLVVLI